jgi:hypothetical protein
MTKQIGSEDWFDTHVVVLSDKAGEKDILHEKIKDMVYEKARKDEFEEWVWVTLNEQCEEIRSQEQLESYVYNEYDKALLDKFTAKFIKETCGYAFQVHYERQMDFMNDQRDN